MTVEEAICALLKTLGPVTALVSMRIYLDKLPQTPTYPCLRVTLIDEQTTYHLRGGSGPKSALVQVDAYAKEVSGVDPYQLVAAVADAVHGDEAGSGLSGWQGTLSASPPVYFEGIFRRARKRFYDPEELKLLTMSQDYQISCRI